MFILVFLVIHPDVDVVIDRSCDGDTEVGMPALVQVWAPASADAVEHVAASDDKFYRDRYQSSPGSVVHLLLVTMA